LSRGHDHGVSIRAGSRYRGRLAIVLGLVVIFMVVEAFVAWISGSLALLSDAGHMATDALGIGMALAAIIAADRVTENKQRTFGAYRLEVLAALANSVLLFAVAGYVIFEAVRRLTGGSPEVLSGPMLVVAVLGLLVNAVSFFLLRQGAGESLNVEGAFVEVLADMLGSVAVIVAALIIWLTGWVYVDAIFGIGIGLFILPRAWRLGRKALRILVEAAPDSIDLGRMAEQLRAIPGVVDVHDLHVWTLTSDMDAASAHITTADGTDPHPVLDAAREILEDGYGIGHATFQVEPESHTNCGDVTW
jgi:cobalt-zinc-cadmium efflux system protein